MLTALFSLLYLKKKRQLSLPLPVNPLNKKKKKYYQYYIPSTCIGSSLSLCVSTTGYRNIRSEPKNSTPVFITDPFKFQSSRHFPTWLSLSAPSLSLSKKIKRFTFWLPFSSLLQSKQPSTTSCEFFHSLSNLSLF